jgi:hypothetical protein
MPNGLTNKVFLKQRADNELLTLSILISSSNNHHRNSPHSIRRGSNRSTEQAELLNTPYRLRHYHRDDHVLQRS